MKQLGVSLLPLGRGVSPLQLTPSLPRHLAGTHLCSGWGVEREALGEWSVECHAQEHAIMTRPGLDARPLDKSKIENRRLKKVELF